MKLLKVFSGFLIVVLFTLFATANMQKVRLNFLFEGNSLLGEERISSEQGNTVSQPREVSVFLIVYGAFGVGFILAWAIGLNTIRIQKRKLKEMARINLEHEKELNTLRNLPVSISDESLGKK